MFLALTSSTYGFEALDEVPLADTRAHRMVIAYAGGWHLIPFPEAFSRHAGTCVVLGDKTTSMSPYEIKVGDCFRIGSVGLLVSEMKLPGEEEQHIDARTLQFFKDELLDLETRESLAPLAAEESVRESVDNSPMKMAVASNFQEDDGEHTVYGDWSPEKKPLKTIPEPLTPAVSFLGGGGLTNGEKYICYMCYETHDTEEDALVAPCECKGDTRYVHVKCMQKW